MQSLEDRTLPARADGSEAAPASRHDSGARPTARVFRGHYRSYRIVSKLGSGGMADVFLAVTDSLGGVFSKLVALKRPREDVSGAEYAALFLDEARLASRLNHPNVVQTIDSARDGERPFLVMEYLDGQPLQRVVSRLGAALTREMRIALLSDVLGALHYAHELTDFDGTPLHVVHRDVSPHNVFVTYDGQVKLVDFGIARAKGGSSAAPARVLGKTAYMAPEQARGGAVDRRADIFAVGVMLYEAITGGRYWDRDEAEISRALVQGTLPPRPSERASHVPKHLEFICMRALAFDPARRFATALDMQNALDAYVDRAGSRHAGRKIGAALAREFAQERERIKRVVEIVLVRGVPSDTDSARLMRVFDVSSDARLGPDEKTPALGSIVTRVGPPSTELLAAVANANANATATVVIGADTKPTRSRDEHVEHRRVRVLLAAVMLLLVGSGIGLLVAHGTGHAHDGGAVPAAPEEKRP